MSRESVRPSRALWLGAFVAVLVLALGLPGVAHAAGILPVYRFFNISNGSHFYTANAAEKDQVIATLSASYRFEGVGWYVDTDNPRNNMPVYRFFNLATGEHFYTANEGERAYILANLPAFRPEGISYYDVSLDPVASTPVFRFLNLRNGTHFFTANAAEKDQVIASLSATYRFEGPVFYLAGPIGSDTVAPTTTSDVVPRYFLTAIIHLTATDNLGGSGVARINWILDGLPGTGGLVTTNGLDVHILEFWSVDAAGNTETPHHTVSFTVTLTDMPWHVSTTRFCTQSGCHLSSLTQEHYRWPVGPGPYLNCITCHESTNPQVMAAISAGSDSCIDCHFYTTGAIDSYPHAGTTVAHALPALTCTQSGCHADGDLATIHEGPPAKTATTSGCRVCHANGVTPRSNCITCHGALGPHGNHAVIPSTSTGDFKCTQAACHGTSLVTPTVHKTCAACHAPTANRFVSVTLTDNVVDGANATCESCHISYATVHAAGNVGHAISGSCFVTACHNSSDKSLLHLTGDDPPGCAVCHTTPGVVPTQIACGTCHPDLETFHGFVHRNATGANSSACTTCHGTDLPTVHTALGCFCHTTSYLRGEMTPLLAAGTAECADCHNGRTYAPHAFGSKTGPVASGHNAQGFPTIGAKTLWNGTEGVVVKSSAEETITQEWPLPTSGVFWSDSKGLALNGTVDGSYSLNPTDAPAAALAGKGLTPSMIRTDVGWGSVVRCQDCHTNLDSSMGPQGANVGAVGLDPNFPDDWTRAEITSFDPTGMRSIETTRGTANPYYSKYGSYVNMGPDNITTETVAGVPASVATVLPGGFYKATANPSNGYSAGVKTGRFICQKCHKLTNSFQGLGIEGNGRGFRSNNMNYMGFSNEAHMEHHADMVTGQANCVSCHIAIPHGWKRPRLLVYESDPAPYKVQWYLPNYWLSSGSDRLSTSPNMAVPGGNWGWQGGGSGTYAQVGTVIPNGTTNGANEVDPVAGVVVNNSAKTYSSHLEKIAATGTALKELVIGPATAFQANDSVNGTKWGLWDDTATGSEWLPDTSPNALYSSEAIQNNCTACTSAGLTHSDTGGTSEGVADNPVAGRTAVGGGTWSEVPFWK